MKYLWAEWDKLKPLFLSKEEKLILLDFDGTLTPIVKTPDAVKVDPEIKRILKNLSQAPHYRLVIISGRPVEQLRKYLHLPKALYVGNHGLELEGWSLPLPPKAKKARKLKQLIKMLAGKFKMAFNSSYEGVIVEDKHFTLSLHFRNLPKEEELAFHELVRYFRGHYRNFPLTWTLGKKVWEIRPSIFWGKEDAAWYLMQHFPCAVPVAIGDDKADEDVFKILKGRGVAIRVGNSKTSKAKYYLNSPHDVKVFLKRVCP